jgi:hypothetical protein
MNQTQAEKVALQALNWLASDDELVGLFLDTGGASVNDLKQIANDPAFLGSVMDFVLMDDSLIMRFCDAHNLAYETPMLARHSLPGGDMVNWT